MGRKSTGRCLREHIIGLASAEGASMSVYRVRPSSTSQDIYEHQLSLITMPADIWGEGCSLPQEDRRNQIEDAPELLGKRKYSCVSSSYQGTWKAHVQLLIIKDDEDDYQACDLEKLHSHLKKGVAMLVSNLSKIDEFAFIQGDFSRGKLNRLEKLFTRIFQA